MPTYLKTELAVDQVITEDGDNVILEDWPIYADRSMPVWLMQYIYDARNMPIYLRVRPIADRSMPITLQAVLQEDRLMPISIFESLYSDRAMVNWLLEGIYNGHAAPVKTTQNRADDKSMRVTLRELIEQDTSAPMPILTEVINDLSLPISWLEGSIIGPIVVDRQMIANFMAQINGDEAAPLAYAETLSNDESMPAKTLEGINNDSSMPVPIIGVAKVSRSVRVDILENIMKEESANVTLLRIVRKDNAMPLQWVGPITNDQSMPVDIRGSVKQEHSMPIWIRKAIEDADRSMPTSIAEALVAAHASPLTLIGGLNVDRITSVNLVEHLNLARRAPLSWRQLGLVQSARIMPIYTMSGDVPPVVDQPVGVSQLINRTIEYAMIYMSPDEVKKRIGSDMESR